MRDVSQRFRPSEEARDLAHAWACPRAYDDRAVEHSKLAARISQRNVQSWLLAISAHYRSRAQSKPRAADEAASQNCQSEATVARNGCRFWTHFVLVLLPVVLTAMIAAAFDFARAEDCLAAPNSAAPKGSHWYYHLNRATQQKCWYTRSNENRPQNVSVKTRPANGEVPPANVDRVGSIGSRNDNVFGGKPKSIQKISEETTSDTVVRAVAATTAPNPPAPDTNPQAAAATTPAWPDSPPIPTLHDAEAEPQDAAYSVAEASDDISERGKQGSKLNVSIAIFSAIAFTFTVLAFGRLFLMKRPDTRRAQQVNGTESPTNYPTKPTETEFVSGLTNLNENVFDSFVSAASDDGPLARIIRSGHAIEAREARLAELREDIGQRLSVGPSRTTSIRHRTSWRPS
jgi:hypothetical protein